MASSISQLGILEAEHGIPAAAVIARHVKELKIRLRLGIRRPRSTCAASPPAARHPAGCQRLSDQTRIRAW